MSRILIKWRKVLEETFNYTYSMVLSNDEIQERINFVLSKLNNINPNIIYNCLLYSDTRFEVGKIAIDYRIGFCSPDYVNVVESGISYEIDNLKHPEKELIMRDINGVKVLFNLLMFKRINSEDEIDIAEEIEQINKHFRFEIHDEDECKWVPTDHVHHLMTRNQFCYTAVFHQNPFDGMPLSVNVEKSIKNLHFIRCELFELLKNKYPSGINLTYVRNTNFFG
jgi:hypothetical protein